MTFIYLSKMGQTQELLWLGKAFVLLNYRMQLKPSSLGQNGTTCKYQACLCPPCGWPILFFHSKVLLTAHPRLRITGWLLVKLLTVAGFISEARG